MTETKTKEILEVKSGVTSVFLDAPLLDSAAGLKLASTNNTVSPVSDKFSAGFQIDEDSDFTFSTQKGFIPLGGTIEHDGTVTFNTKSGSVTVGDFSIGFDASRKTDDKSGFFVKDTAGTGAILFDVGDPDVAEVKDRKLTIDKADLLVSSEFSNFLNKQGLATNDLTGADVGDIASNAIVETASVGDAADRLLNTLF